MHGETSDAHLFRGLGLFSAVSVVAGSVIGSAVFLVAADISRSLPSPLLAVSVWVSAGLLSLAGCLTFAELAAMYPGAGGQYLYLREAFGPLTAFLFGWTLFLVIQSGSIAAVAVTVAQFASAVVPMSPLVLKLAASVLIAALTAVNLFGVRKGAGLLDALTVFKVAALAVLAGAGLLLPARQPLGGFAPAGVPAYGVALIAALWAYDGWNDVTFVAGEVRDPHRNLPLSLAGGIGIVTAAYVLVNAAFYLALPSGAVAASSFPAADAARVWFGARGPGALAVVVSLSALGCLNGMILAGPRVTYAMAGDGTVPAALAYVHPRYRVPTTALLAQMAWSILLVWSGRYDQLFTCVVFAAFIFYGLAAAGVIVLRRKRPKAERPYRVPFYPALPALYALFCAAFVLNALREKPVESLAGAALVGLGLPVYFAFRRRG